ncbi:cytochrome P450, partial [Epithele typhae]|uniref:cytochrome P450 n=1 Tax=Epithele typhae TaxID=378194 RepID=UPI0020083AB6
GEVMYFGGLGKSFLVLGSVEVMSEFLEKRSGTTSSRSATPLIELTGSDFNFGFMPYGQRWRAHRRAFWNYMHRDACRAYQDIQRGAAHLCLDKILSDPANLRKHLKFNFSASALKAIYGIDIDEKEDVYEKVMHDTTAAVSQGLVPGKWLVEYLPVLRHVPTWFPGARSQRIWAKWQAYSLLARNLPYDYALSAMASDRPSVQDSIVGRLLANSPVGPPGADVGAAQGDDIIKNVAAVGYEALITAWQVYSTLLGTMLALSLNHEVVVKAHAELDAVVGAARMPDFDDESSLVYIKAIVMEALRWHNVTSVGVPHATTEDQQWRGWFIPSGTVVIANQWYAEACMHDASIYPDPFAFRPGRFIRNGRIDETLLSPFQVVFGFGRRICPGRYFGLNGLFITVASILHVFDITAPVDERGQPFKIEPTFTDGFLSYPEDSRCTVLPRSPEHEKMIRSHAEAYRAARSQS